MSKYFKWFALFMLALILTALFEPILMGKVQETGFHDDPVGTVKPAMNWIARIIGDTAFFWFAGGAIGFAAGVWLDAIVRRISNKKRDDIISLGNDAVSLAGSLAVLSNNHLASPQSYPYENLHTDVEILRGALSKHSIPLITRESGVEFLSPTSTKEANSDYLKILGVEMRSIGKYLQTGDLALAKKKAIERVKVKQVESVALAEYKRLIQEDQDKRLAAKYPKPPSANSP